MLVKRPLGKAQSAKLDIHSWSTTERLHFLAEGRFLKELYDDSLVLAPLEPRARKVRAHTTTGPGEAVQQAFLWIDSTNAFNTICRLLIKEAVTLFVPEWLNLYAACYEIKTELIICAEVNTAPDITSEEGVHLARLAEFAPAHLTAAHVELELDACAAALAHVHPELRRSRSC
jgi:hypothetical protein